MLGNWIKQTTTTTGTGALALAAVSGFPGFSSQFATSERFSYAIIDDATGGPIERGIGYLDGSGDLVRERTMATFVGGTYTGANPSAADLPAGTKRVVCVEGAQTALTSAPGVWGGASYKGYGDLSGTAAINNIALTADRAYAVQFAATVDADIDAIIFRVTTAAASGKLARCAVFSVGGDGLPGIKLAESANIAVDFTGIKQATFTIFRPPPRFFVGIVSDGAPVVQSLGTSFPAGYTMGYDSVLVPHSYIHHAGAAGLTFPGTWTAVGNATNTARPQLVCRVP